MPHPGKSLFLVFALALRGPAASRVLAGIGLGAALLATGCTSATGADAGSDATLRDQSVNDLSLGELAPLDAATLESALDEAPGADVGPEADTATTDGPGADALAADSAEAGADALAADAAEASCPSVARTTLAYAMHSAWAGANPDNIIPLYVPTAAGLTHTDTLGAAREVADNAALFFTSAGVPPGRRVVFDGVLAYHLFRPDFLPAGDRLPVTLDGGAMPYCGRFRWPRGVADTSAAYAAFFAQLASRGVTLDELHLDYEAYSPSTYQFASPPRTLQRDPAPPPPLVTDAEYQACAAAMVADTDFRSAVEPVLRAYGFTPSTLTDPVALAAMLRGGQLPMRPEGMQPFDYLRWNGVADDTRTQQLHSAVWAQASAHNPAIRVSAYESYHRSVRARVPDGDGHEVWRYGEGGHVGTHQSPHAYGIYRQLDIACLLDPTGYLCTGHSYGRSAAGALRYGVLRLQGALLSSRVGAEPPVPLRPWVAYRRWSECPASSYGTVASTDYYQELILHTVMTGADAVYLFNPAFQPLCADPTVPSTCGAPPSSRTCVSQADAFSDSELRLLSDLLHEADAVLPCGPRVPLLRDSLTYAAFRETLLASGVRVGEQNYWRVTPTPDLTSGPAPAAPVDPCTLLTVEGSGSAATLVLRYQGQALRIPGGALAPASVCAAGAPPRRAPLGLWIVQPATSPPLTLGPG